MPSPKGKTRAKPAAVETKKAEVKQCKSCSQELRRMPWDSRSEGFYVFVCINKSCDLYNRFQDKEGEIPHGINIVFV